MAVSILGSGYIPVVGSRILSPIPDTGSESGLSIVSGDINNYIITSTGAGDELKGEENLTFNGTTLVVTGAVTISTTLGVTGNITAASNIYATGLSSGATTSILNYNTGTGAITYNSSGGGTTKYLRADGSWEIPSGTGSVSIASGDTATYMMTSTGVGDELQGEEDVTYDGTTLTVDAKLTVGGSANTSVIAMDTTGNAYDWTMTANGTAGTWELNHYGGPFININSGTGVIRLGDVSGTIDTYITGDLNLTGDGNITGDANISGDVTVGGDESTSIFKMDSDNDGYPWIWTNTDNTTLELEQHGDSYLELDRSSTLVTVGQDFAVTGESTFNDDTTIDGDLTIGGSEYLSTLNFDTSSSAINWILQANGSAATLGLSYNGNSYLTVNNSTDAITLGTGDVTIAEDLIIGGGNASSVVKMDSSTSAYPWIWTNTNNATLALEQHSDSYISCNTSTGITVGQSAIFSDTITANGESTFNDAVVVDAELTVGGSANTAIINMDTTGNAYDWTMTANGTAATWVLDHYGGPFISIDSGAGSITLGDASGNVDTEVTGDLTYGKEFIEPYVEYTTAATYTPAAGTKYINADIPTSAGTIYIDLDNLETSGRDNVVYLSYEIDGAGSTIIVRNSADTTLISETMGAATSTRTYMLHWNNAVSKWRMVALTLATDIH